MKRLRLFLTIIGGYPYGDDITTDSNQSYEAAIAICDLLVKEGWGGEGKTFPLKTWIEPND